MTFAELLRSALLPIVASGDERRSVSESQYCSTGSTYYRAVQRPLGKKLTLMPLRAKLASAACLTMAALFAAACTEATPPIPIATLQLQPGLDLRGCCRVLGDQHLSERRAGAESGVRRGWNETAHHFFPGNRQIQV